MTVAAPGADLFEDAPPRALQWRLGLVKPDAPQIGRRALLVVIVGWVPLVVLTVVQSLAQGNDVIRSLALETGAHARYLIAAPLLVIAEAQCAPSLGIIVRHFADAGLVREREHARFDAAVASTRRLIDSTVAEIVVIVLAYLTVAAAVYSYGYDRLPLWHASDGTTPVYSLAGWWHVLISMPLLLMLLLGWMWRLALWARLLWLTSRLDLRLVPSHPDRAAGLGFVGHSVQAFSIVALAFAAIVAGRSAHLVLLGAALPTPELVFNAGVLVAILALFTAPLLVFTPTLMRAWQRGTFEHGALAERIGAAFEDKWLGADKLRSRSALEAQDFSSVADFYSVVANVHAIRMVPVSLKDLISLAVAMLVPFVPVLFLAVPMDTILQSLKKLLL